MNVKNAEPTDPHPKIPPGCEYFRLAPLPNGGSDWIFNSPYPDDMGIGHCIILARPHLRKVIAAVAAAAWKSINAEDAQDCAYQWLVWGGWIS